MWLVLLGACQPSREPPAPTVGTPDASIPTYPRKSPRVVGCRERTMRVSGSMCEFRNLWVPATDATPDELKVEAVDGITVDACLRAWELLARRCDEVRP